MAVRFSNILTLRVQDELAASIQEEAGRQGSKESDEARRPLVEALRAHGRDPLLAGPG
jgi:hypothetical protein